MNRKQAHQRKIFSFYNRHEVKQWGEDYTAEQLKWLWDNKHIEYDKPLYHLGENDNQKYIKFTKKGQRWRNWYSCSFKEYIKYYVTGNVIGIIKYKIKSKLR